MTYPLLLRGESVISALVFFWEQRILLLTHVTRDYVQKTNNLIAYSCDT